MTFCILLALLTLPSKQADEALDEARSLVESGHGLEALATLREASLASPEDPRLQYQIGTLLSAAGRASEALPALRRAFELSPDEPDYALAYGELLYRGGEAEQALAPLEDAAPLPRALLLLAGAYEKLGRNEEAIATLARYVEAKPEEAGARLLLGEKLESAKRDDEALALYRRGLETSPEDVALLLRAGELLGRKREGYEAAERLARRALARDASLLDAQLLLARLLDRTGRSEEALELLESAVESHPEASRARYALAQAYQRAGRAEEAAAEAARFQELSVAEKEREERDARVAVTYKKAAEALSQGDMGEAESVFRSVLEIDPEHAQTRAMLAKIRFSRGDVAGALRWIEEAIERDGNVAEYYYLKALFLARAGRGAEAEAPLTRSLELGATFPDAWSLLGTLLLDAGRAKEAVGCFQNAAALEPGNAAVQLNLASAYASLGDAEREREAMERYRALIQSPE